MQEADFYKIVDDKIECLLCPHFCKLKDGQKGICGVRKNIGNKLYTDIYGQVSSIAIDPIEKKPLYHFYPGSKIFSIGTVGCNLKCPYCQNWQISQNENARTSFYSKEKIVEAALEKNSFAIAYTYSEPIVWYEFVSDTAILAREKKLKNVMVTNGFISENPLLTLQKKIDAFNVDLKTFSSKTFKRVHKGNLNTVKENIIYLAKSNSHLEITTLVVTGVNDTLKELMEIAQFIASIDKSIPWHISKYFPAYKYNKQETDINLLLDVYKEASKFLDYVYCGNVSSAYKLDNTHCKKCGEIVIERSGYNVKKNLSPDGRCLKCNTLQNIIF